MNTAIIGNIVRDTTIYSDEFIVEGEKHSFDNVSFITGGPASTAASVLARFHNTVDFYGQIGNDPEGEFVYNEMSREGINMNHVNKSNNMMTPQGFVIVTNDKRTIVSLRSPKDLKHPTIDDIKYETGYDYILTDGKYVEESINLIKLNTNAISIIDAGRVNSGVLKLCKYVDYIICSEEFANKVTGGIINDDYENNTKIYKKLKNYYKDAKGITITVGSRGYICEKDGEVVNFPAYDSGMKAIDTNGAGDIFHGAFTHAISNGYDYYDSLKFANITASLSTTKLGGRKSCPSLQEVEEIMHQKKYFKGR